MISFFSGWNEYVFAVTFAADPNMQPASVGSGRIHRRTEHASANGHGRGGLYTLPAVAFYLVAQKYVVSGMTAGAVKG